MPDNRLPTNQSQLDIVEKLDEIKDAIAQGGGGGTGGHTIIDENGTSMSARAGLQFVGANVDDDATNNKTIVDLASAGGIDGVFIDTENEIYSGTYSNANSLSYTATEDCIAIVPMVSASNDATSGQTYIYVNGVEYCRNFNGASSQVLIQNAIVSLKKGQVLTATTGRTLSAIEYRVYGIQTGTTHSKFQPVIYSTEEREIGVWEDGKPLYQKTFELTIPSGSGAYEHTFTEAAIPNLDKAVATSYSLFGIGERAYVPWYQQATVVLDEQSATGVTFYFASNNYAGRIIYYTAQYTKTTDVAGSGSWTPQGVPAVHYSTDEQVIGTWLGETLYQKTLHISNVQFDSTGIYDLNLTSMGTDILIADNSCSYYTFSTYVRNFEKLVPEDGHIYCYGVANRPITDGYITIKYTKTS